MNQHHRPSPLFKPISKTCAKASAGSKHRNPGNIHGGLVALLLAVITLPVVGQMAATSNGKFLGNIIKSTTTVDPVFDTYWNQVTPENSGKWDSVESTRDVMNWTQLDFAYNYTRTRGIPFKLHTLVWGQQYPTWMDSLPENEQREEVEEWIAALAARYPGTEFIDVVNEALPGHAPAPFRNALGGAGTTGWDWVIWSFQKARQSFPNARLILNDYNVINSDSATTSYLTLINLLKDRGLIDGIGEQAHNFESTSVTTLQNNLNRLAATGLPIYISELDIDIANDQSHLARYQALFPVFWTHTSVRGITLWGYKQGQMWRENGFLLRTDGTERQAMEWLRTYIAENPQSFSASVTSPANGQGLSNVSPVSASATVTYGTAPFTVTFQKKLDSETEFTTVSSDTTAPYTADLGMLPVGTYQVRVMVTDADSATVTSAPNSFNVYLATGGTWLGMSGNWDDPGIWTGGTIANGADATASFTGVDIAADQAIALNGSRTIGNIVFTDAPTPSHNLTISGADTLTLALASGSPVINVTQADRTLTVSSPVAGNDGLQKAGSGTLALSGNNTYTGTTTVSSGELRLSGGAYTTTARTYQINLGAVLSFSGAHQNPNATTTTIQGNGTLRILSGASISAGADNRRVNINLGAGSLIDVQAGGSFGVGYQGINWASNKATLNMDGNHNFWDDTAIIAAALTGSGTIASTNTGDSYGTRDFTLGVENGSGTFTGTITAAGARLMNLIKTGTGTQTFFGSTTFRGTTSVNGGSLHYAKAASLYAGLTTDWVKTKITVNNGCTIAFNVGGTDEFTTGDVSTLLTGLGGAVNNNGLRAGSTLAFDTTNAGGGTFTVADAIANSTGTGGGAIGLRKLGANTLVLSNSNTYTGPTNVDQGTLAVTGSLGATAVNVNGGILTGNGNFGGNVTIGPGAMISHAVASNPASQDTSAITGTLALAQSTINLTAASTPADGVYVLATATVAITGSSDFINYNGITGTVSVDTASTPKRLLLTVNGSPPSLSASVTAPANGQVVSNVSSVTASAAVSYGSAPFTVTFQKKLDAESEFTTVSSDITAPYTADLGILPVGIYQIRVVVTDNASATVTSAPNTFTVSGGPISLSWDGGTTDIAGTGDGASGGGDGTWDTTIKNWDLGNGLAHTAWNNATNDTAIFGGSAGSISLGTGVTVGGMTFDSAYTVDSNTITFGTAGTITNSAAVTIASALAGTVPITKAGVGRLTLSGNNTYTGTTVINNGILAISSNNALGATSGNTTIAATGSNTDRRLTLSGNINSAENISVSGSTETGAYASVISSTSGTNTLSGNITLAGANGIRLGANGGNLILAGAINQTGTAKTLLLAATGGDITVNNAIANGTAALSIISQGGGGSVTLKAAQGAGGIGAVTIAEGGKLKLGITNAIRTDQTLTIGVSWGDTGTFDLAGFNQTVNGLVGVMNASPATSRIVTNSATGTSVLTVGNGNGTGTFNGVIQDGGVGKIVALTKSGAGTQTLVGDSNYSGVTNISVGTLAITHSNALGSTAGTTTIAATGSSSTGGILALSNNINSPENITITGVTESSGFSSAIVNTGGTNTLSGNITLASPTGGIRLGATGGSLTFSGNISQTGTSQGLAFGTSSGTTIAVNKPIANNGGGLSIYGAGSVTLLGVNGVGGIGSTTVSQGGTLKLGVSDALNTSGNLTLNQASGATATFDLAGLDQTVNALVSAGTGTNAERKVINSVAGTKILTVGNGDGSGTFNGQINTGTGNIELIKTGTGTQTLNDVNSYTGGTRIDNGTLALGVGGSINASASVTIKPGATLNTSAQASYTIPTGKPVNFGVDGTGSGSSGKISAAALNVSNATVTYNITGPLDDAAYVLATYTPGSLTGTFLSAPADPIGYTLSYAYGGNKIALVQTGGNNYLSWAASQVPPVTGGENGDDDNDGVKNLVEYALIDGGENGALDGNTITFTKRGGAYGSDLTYIIETSETLASGSWSDAVTHGPDLLISNPTISYTFTPGTPVKKFVRLRVTGP